MLKATLIIAVTFFIASCSPVNKTSINKDYYNYLDNKETTFVYKIFKKESQKTIVGNNYYTNTTIILGKRSDETINELKKETFEHGNRHLFFDLFESLAFYSKINVCNQDFYARAKMRLERIGEGNSIDCEYYEELLEVDKYNPPEKFKPKFLRG